MSEAKPSHPQHEHESGHEPGHGPGRSPWQALRDAHAARSKQWRAHADLLAEQVAEQGGATLGAGLRLWGESLRIGWTLGRQWQTVTLDAWRRSLDLLR